VQGRPGVAAAGGERIARRQPPLPACPAIDWAKAACGHSQKFTAQRDVFEIGCYSQKPASLAIKPKLQDTHFSAY
jgi:hypothetical protein